MSSGSVALPVGQDAALPVGDIIWSRRKMVGFFHRELKPAVCPAVDVTEVAIQSMKYSPGRTFSILYSLQFDNGQSGNGPARLSGNAVASFGRDDELEGVYAKHYGSGRPDAMAAPSAAYLPVHRCLVELFPLDWQLPSLSQATDAAEVTSLLAGATGNGGNTEAWSRTGVKVVRYRPHEACVLQYSLQPMAGDSPKQVIGKLYREGPRAALVWRALNALHGQEGPSGVTIPQPLALRDEWKLVLMERAAGTSMKWVLEQAATKRQAREVTRLAATALAAYHGLRFDAEEVRSVQTALGKLQKRAALLRRVAPFLSEQVDALLRRIEPLALGCGVAIPSFIHGDFKPSQLLIDGDRVAIVDFDRACLGDPALDVGNFMAQFNKSALRTGHDYLRRLAPYFLAQYQARLPVDGLDGRARLFQAISLVRMAVRKFESSPHSYAQKGSSSVHVSLLREATECLDQL